MFLNFIFWFADLVKTTRIFLESSFDLRINNSYRAVCFDQVLKTLGWTIVKEIGKVIVFGVFPTWTFEKVYFLPVLIVFLIRKLPPSNL